MEWKAASRLFHAFTGRKNVEKLANAIGARYIPSIVRSAESLAADGSVGEDHRFSQRAEIAALQEESDRLGVSIPWGKPPFEKVSHRAIFNYVGIERSYGAVSAYECAFLPAGGADSPDESENAASTEKGNFLAPAQLPFGFSRAFIYDFVIPGQVADPALTPSQEDDADVDFGLRTPDADADIRFLEDRAASLCDEPEVLDLEDHHVVVLRDIGMAERQSFYEGLIPIAQDVSRS